MIQGVAYFAGSDHEGVGGEMMSMDNRIRELRNERSMSCADLADAIGISEIMLLSYEAGMETIPMVHVRKMCDLFECTGDYLFAYFSLSLNMILKFASIMSFSSPTIFSSFDWA